MPGKQAAGAAYPMQATRVHRPPDAGHPRPQVTRYRPPDTGHPQGVALL